MCSGNICHRFCQWRLQSVRCGHLQYSKHRNNHLYCMSCSHLFDSLRPPRKLSRLSGWKFQQCNRSYNLCMVRGWEISGGPGRHTTVQLVHFRTLFFGTRAIHLPELHSRQVCYYQPGGYILCFLFHWILPAGFLEDRMHCLCNGHVPNWHRLIRLLLVRSWHVCERHSLFVVHPLREWRVSDRIWESRLRPVRVRALPRCCWQHQMQ